MAKALIKYMCLMLGLLATAARSDDSAALKTRSVLSEGQWQMQLVASCNDLRDAFNYFGVAAPNGRGDIAEILIESPPLISPFVDLSFMRPENDSRAMGSSGYAFDLRRSLTGKTLWHFEVQTDIPNAEITISWPNLLSAAPKHYNFTLVDTDSNHRCFMRTTGSYAFRSGETGGTRHFIIEVDPKMRSPLVIAGLSAAGGRSGNISVRYTLSREAATTACVLTLTGKPVRLLEKSRARTRASQVIGWDLRDNAGRRVPSGSYLFQIKAQTETGESAQAALPVAVR